jgi:hypothetical protein
LMNVHLVSPNAHPSPHATIHLVATLAHVMLVTTVMMVKSVPMLMNVSVTAISVMQAPHVLIQPDHTHAHARTVIPAMAQSAMTSMNARTDHTLAETTPFVSTITVGIPVPALPATKAMVKLAKTAMNAQWTWITVTMTLPVVMLMAASSALAMTDSMDPVRSALTSTNVRMKPTPATSNAKSVSTPTVDTLVTVEEDTSRTMMANVSMKTNVTQNHHVTTMPCAPTPKVLTFATVVMDLTVRVGIVLTSTSVPLDTVHPLPTVQKARFALTYLDRLNVPVSMD